jgi:hypothetical protein
MSPTTITIIVVVVIVFIILLMKSSKPRLRSLEETIQYLSSEAVDVADKCYSIPLDFSVESVKKTEEILAKLHEEYLKKNSQKGVRGLAMAFGAYIGECIRKTEQGVDWALDHPVGGKKSYPLHWAGEDLFPMAWCFRRITNGPEDNVWHKYKVLIEKRNKQAPPNRNQSGSGLHFTF